jgi:hypothetical protein
MNVSAAPTPKILNVAHKSPTSLPNGPNNPASTDNPIPPATTSNINISCIKQSPTWFRRLMIKTLKVMKNSIIRETPLQESR